MLESSEVYITLHAHVFLFFDLIEDSILNDRVLNIESLQSAGTLAENYIIYLSSLYHSFSLLFYCVKETS